jgi:hypothetical protein
MLNIGKGNVMNSVKTKGKYTVSDFICDLLCVNGISHETLLLYEDENRDEILHINDIFSLKTEEDVRQCAVLLRLLCPEYADKVAGYFLNGNLPETLCGLMDVDRYKLKLLAGLEYNYKFFSLAWNWRTSLREKVMRNLIQLETAGKRNPAGIRLWPSGINLGSLNMMQRASTRGNNIIHHKTVDLGDNIKGDLYIIDRTEGKIESRFVFTEYLEKIPYLKITVGGKEIFLKEFVRTRSNEKILKSGVVPMIDPKDNLFIERLPEDKND